MNHVAEQLRQQDQQATTSVTVGQEACGITPELIHLLYRQGPIALGFSLFVSLLLSVLLWRIAEENWLLYWIVALILTCGLCGLLVRAFYRADVADADVKHWARLYALGAFFIGLAWGLAAFLWAPEWPVTYQIMLLLFLIGISTGVISSYVPYLPSYYAFISPILIPIAFILLIQQEGYRELALLLLLYLGMLLIMAHRHHSTLRESLLRQHENQALFYVMEKQIEQLQMDAVAYEKTQSELSLLNETLELRVAERTQVLHREIARRLESEQKFSVIAESAQDAIIMIDDAGMVVYWNRAAEQILGYAEQEAIGHSLHHLILPQQTDAEHAAVFPRSTQPGEGMALGKTFELAVTHKTGDEIPVELSISAVQLHARWHTVGIFRDISARKLAEQDRQRMEVQLHHAQKLEAVGQLAAGIAHEINTPTQFVNDNTHFLRDAWSDCDRLVTAYQGLAEATANSSLFVQIRTLENDIDLDYLKVEVPQAIEQSLEGLTQIARIVQAMKAFSHPGAGEKIPTDLNRAIETTLDVSRSEWKYCAELITELDPKLPQVEVLPGEFNQVILNLIVNAAHAIGSAVGEDEVKGRIRISTQRDGEWVEIRIRDNGSGMSEAVKNRIFEPFYTSKEVGKGSGQGLAITWSVIVDKHNGTIEVESDEGAGATFIVRLPIIAGESQVTQDCA